MSFKEITQMKASDQVVDQLEKLILHGVLRAGEKLPAERDLAAEMGVSRPVLRDALTALQDKDLIEIRKGAGVFVADFLGAAFAPAMIDLFTSHEEAHADFLAFRREIEGIAAERAARFGLEGEHAHIQVIYEDMKAAHDAGDRAREIALDVDFHMSVMEASQNVFMLHMFRSMIEMLRRGVFFNRSEMFNDSTTASELMAQHERIVTAILKRDGQSARSEMEAHLDYISDTVRTVNDQRRKEDILAMRKAHKARN